jgi:hypothetical protein
LPHESIMKTIELLGKEIIPELRKHEIEAEVKVSGGGPTDPDKLAQGIID